MTKILSKKPAIAGAIALCFSLALALPLSGFADEAQGDFLCAQTMVTEGAAAVADYELLLNEFFQADVSSADQVQVAMSYYRAVENTLNTLYANGLDVDGIKSFDLANAEVAACAARRDELIRYSQVLLEAQTLGSANSKRTFAVRDGLNALNENMNLLSDEFAQTFPARFQNFESAFPCYAQECR
jgi:hypothetical protein